jgi:hypothetical protein
VTETETETDAYPRVLDLTAAGLAERFHEAYERLAPGHGYETREVSAKPWSEVPEQNRRLMTAVCAEILEWLTLEVQRGCDSIIKRS